MTKVSTDSASPEFTGATFTASNANIPGADPSGITASNAVLDFIYALHDGHEGDMPFMLGDITFLASDKNFILANKDKFHALPSDGEQVFFLFGIQEESTREAWRECRAKPTAVLWRDGFSMFCWAFELPVQHDAKVQALVEAFGMEALGEGVPLPGQDGWELIRADKSVFYTVDRLAEVYLADVATDESVPVADKTAPKSVLAVGEMYREAVVVTPYDITSFMDRKITVSIGGYKDSKNWKRKEVSVAVLIDKYFTTNDVGQKDGPGIMFGDMPDGQRLKEKVTACTAIPLDYDTGVTTAQAVAALTKQNLAGVCYTSYNHMKSQTVIKESELERLGGKGCEIDSDLCRRYLSEEKHLEPHIVSTVEVDERDTFKGEVWVSHDPIQKFRIVVFLKEPFVMRNEGDTEQEAWGNWKGVIEATANLLGLPNFDRACLNPHHFFYTPRHAKGRPFEMYASGGDKVFDYKTLDYKTPAADPYAGEGSKKGGNNSSTDGGKARGKWALYRSQGFNIVDVIEDHVPDNIRGGATSGKTITCPFASGHTNPDDSADTGCYAVNAGHGSFIIRCRHASCLKYTNLDHLNKMIQDGWFPESVVWDEKYNILELTEDEANFGKPDSEIPQITLEDVSKEIAAFLPKPKPGKTEPPKGAKPDPVQVQALLDKIEVVHDDKQRETMFAMVDGALIGKALKGLVDSARKRANKAAKARPKEVVNEANPQSDALVKKLSGEIGKEFVTPPLHRNEFHLAAMDGGVIWLCGPSDGEEGIGEAYCTPFVVQGEAHYYDDGSRAIRVLVRSSPGQWKPVDIKAAWLAQPSGTEAIAALMDAGWKPRPKGRPYMLEYLSSVEMTAIKVVGRPGWDGETFLLPNGGAIPANPQIELSRKVALTCAAQAGSFEVYQNDVTWLFKHAHGAHFQCAFLIAYAGCLAGLLNDKPLGFYFTGPSGHGKSECQATSVSQFGNGKLGEGLFISGKLTDNATEGPFAQASGTVGAFDEVKYMDPKSLQDIFFMLESGMGKTRSTRDSEIRKSRRWRGGAFILSDESSLWQRLAAARIKVAAGLSVRVACIDFHDSYRFPKEEWARIVRIQANFGWGGPAFVEALGRMGYVTDPGKLRERKDKIASELAEEIAEDHAMKERAARIPAYIQLAAEVLIEAGELPKKFDAKKMGKWVFKNMLDSDLAPENASVKGLAALRSALIHRKDLDVLNYNPPDSKYDQPARKFQVPVAYYNATHKNHPGRKLLVILSSKLTELSGGSPTHAAMLDVLAQEKMLVLDSKGARTWDYFPKLGKDQYVVIDAKDVDGVEETPEVPVAKGQY